MSSRRPPSPEVKEEINATQFEPGGDSDRELWAAITILDERQRKRGARTIGEYLVDWEGTDPATGKRWEPSWEPKRDCTDLLIQEWKAKKKADPEIEGRYTREQEALKKANRNSARRKSSSRAKATTPKRKDPSATESRSVSIEPVKAEKRKRSATVDEDEGQRLKQSATMRQGSTRPADVGSGDDSPQKPPAVKRQRSVAPIPATPRPSKLPKQADTSRRTSRNGRVKSASIVAGSEDEDEVPATPSNGDPDSLEHRLHMQSTREKADKEKGPEVAISTVAARNSKKTKPTVYGKARVRRRKATPEPAPHGSRLPQEESAEFSDEVEKAGNDVAASSVESSHPVPPDLQRPGQFSKTDLEEAIFGKRTARTLGEKHVAFEATQESEESVVPGTVSTARLSQDSRTDEAEPIVETERHDAAAEDRLESGVKTLDDLPEFDSQHESLRNSHSAAHMPSLNAESTRMALEEAMQHRNGSVQVEESRTIDVTISRQDNESEPASQDAVVPASQIDLFQAAVDLMAEYGFEGDDSRSPPSTLDRETITGHAEQSPPSGSGDEEHLSNLEQADLTGLTDPQVTDSQDQSHPIPQPTTPGQQAPRVPARLSPRPLCALGVTVGSMVQHLSYTQETIEQFSSPIRGRLPEGSTQQESEAASPVRTQEDDFELVSPPRPGANQAAPVKQHLEPTVSGVATQSTIPDLNTGPESSDKRPENSTVHLEEPAPPSTDAQQFLASPPSTVVPETQLDAPIQPVGGIVKEAPADLIVILKVQIEELEALVSQQDGKLSITKNELEAAQAATKRCEEETAFLRDLFEDARERAGEFARENTALVEKNAVLKEQLDMGLKQQKLHFEAVITRKDEEMMKLEHQLAFLVEQNRATGDSVRHRAIQYPKLQKKHGNLVEAHIKLQKELKLVKKTNRQLQLDLDMLGPSDDSDKPWDPDEDVQAYPGFEELRARGYAVQPRAHDAAGDILQSDLMEATMSLVMPAPPIEIESPNYRDFVHADQPDAEESVSATATIETSNPPQERAVDASSSLPSGSKQKDSLLCFLESSFAASKLPLDLRVDVIQSGHRKVTETTHVFPYTDVRHKTFESRVLVTVAGRASENMGQDEQAPLMLSALEARVYTLPSKSATIVYISKVDSSGYSALPVRYKPPAITSCLTRSFLRYYLSPETRPTPRVFCQLFARAQKQYLFANSSDGGEKKVLSGLGLCKWWRGVFERVATDIRRDAQADSQCADPTDRIQLQCWLPGTEPAEAKNMLGSTANSPASKLEWSYDPPFGDTQATPMYNPEETVRQLACLIPRFEDDPKARYLDELVISRAGKASAAIRREGANKETEPQASTELTSKALHQKRKDDQARLRQEAALSLQSIKPSDFWATLASRQDCSPGDQTGFIGLALVPAQSSDTAAADGAKLEKHLTSFPGLNPKILDRLVTDMLNHDFGTRKYALTATSRFLNEIERIISAEVGASEWEQNYAVTIPSQGEPVLATATSSSNSQLSAAVNVLQPVRKKKKAPPSISTPTVANRPPSANPESGPPNEAYQCHWRVHEGTHEKCSALFRTVEDLERHVASHMLP